MSVDPGTEQVETVALGAGDLEAAFVPGVGMVGVSLRHRGEELLHRREGLAAYAERGAVMGIPLLHPWANRLDAHDYTVDGRHVRLPDGPPLVHCEEHGLPIHGLLNGSPHWRVVAQDAARLTAALDFAAHPDLMAAFPFPHELVLDAVLEPGGLTVTTTIRAVGDVAVPVAFGFHPYLRLPGIDRTEWQLTLPARRHLATDRRGIPTGEGTAEPAESLALADGSYDDGYDELEDGACFGLAGGGRSITVTLVGGYPAAQVFTPPGGQFVCLEPMTAPTNALRSGAGLRSVPPGGSFTAAFTIAAGPA